MITSVSPASLTAGPAVSIEVKGTCFGSQAPLSNQGAPFIQLAINNEEGEQLRGSAEARRVIEYVLSHGHPSQGSPGTAPRGWSCGYGFGYEHGDSGETETAGPNCSRGHDNVQGTITPLVPVDPYAAP
jgi:hypothetical protein